MRKNLALAGVFLLSLLMVTATAQAQGFWELVYSQSLALNSGFMKCDAVGSAHLYIAGLHQDGPLSAVYAWKSSNGGRTVTPMYRLEMDPSDPCDMMDLMSFILDTQFPTAAHGVLVGMGVPEECKELVSFAIKKKIDDVRGDRGERSNKPKGGTLFDNQPSATEGGV